VTWGRDSVRSSGARSGVFVVTTQRTFEGLQKSGQLLYDGDMERLVSPVGVLKCGTTKGLGRWPAQSTQGRETETSITSKLVEIGPSLTLSAYAMVSARDPAGHSETSGSM
jgi:hypothetical protein